MDLYYTATGYVQFRDGSEFSFTNDIQAEGGGTVFVRGCGSYSTSRFYYVRFKEGDVAYEKWKAEHRGLVRKHVIKRVNVYSGPRSHNQIVINYTDTLNALWMDEELVTHEEALILAEAYLTKKATWAEELLTKGC